jgi:hypothetical protein
MSQVLLLREILSSLDFSGVDKDFTLYYADVNHVDNINNGDAVRIEYRHNGIVDLSLIVGNGQVLFQSSFTTPTVKNLYDFVETGYNARN